jgi:hypothetical protein
MNISILHQELTSIGINISGCDSSGNVQISSRPTCPEGEELTWVDPTDNLVALVLVAHEQPLTSDECLALQNAVSEDTWLAYQECRKQPIRTQREFRYRTEADSLYLKITEDSIKNNTTPDYSPWILLKDTIRTELSYGD